MTVVYEVKDVEEPLDWTKNKVIAIREGNALDTLDNIETNVIAAIRGAKEQL